MREWLSTALRRVENGGMLGIVVLAILLASLPHWLAGLLLAIPGILVLICLFTIAGAWFVDWVHDVRHYSEGGKSDDY